MPMFVCSAVCLLVMAFGHTWCQSDTHWDIIINFTEWGMHMVLGPVCQRQCNNLKMDPFLTLQAHCMDEDQEQLKIETDHTKIEV